MLLRQRSRLAGDQGSALVAAIAVAGIGLALGLTVVAVAVSTASDSARNRASMVEVHGAEGAVDAAYAALEAGTPCTWPASGTSVVSTAPQATSVAVKIDYYDATNSGTKLTCAAGVVTGTPAFAVVTATATAPGVVTGGIAPRRTVQAKVELAPYTSNGAGAAVFASVAGSITNYTTIGSASIDTTADVWMDSGNFDCNSSATINGRLFVAAGGLTTSGSPSGTQCVITGDVSVRDSLGMSGGKIQGNTYVYHGNASLNGTTARIDGGLTVSGTAKDATTGSAATLNVGGAVTQGWTPPAGGLTQVPLPEVNYTPSDWTARGFVIAPSFQNWVKGAAMAGSAWSTGSKSGCDAIASFTSWGIGDGWPLATPTVPTVFDDRACARTYQNTTLVLNADTAIFAKSFNFTNTVNVRSGDGHEHNLWIIVPDPVDDGVAVCTSAVGDIVANSQINFNSSPSTGNINTFLYTPCKDSISNYITIRGQVYGKNVLLQNNLNLSYVGVGIPGVNMFPTTSTTAVNRVDVVYKREIHNPTP